METNRIKFGKKSATVYEGIYIASSCDVSKIITASFTGVTLEKDAIDKKFLFSLN